MRKSTVWVLVSALVFLGPPLALTDPEVSSPSAWQNRWEKARVLVRQGSYSQARRLYESLLKLETTTGQRRLIRKEYEALQTKILFSNTPTPESFFHTVVSGDTLYDLAKKYGTTVELLQKSNGISTDRIYPGMKLKAAQAKFSILIEKTENRLTLLADGKTFKKYRVATGERGSTPTGSFKIINKLEKPTWFHAGSIIPPESPENILGSRWLGFDRPGYGIHGTTLPQTIGTQASKGCIRMLDADVEEIYAIVPLGTGVTVTE